MGSNMDWDTSAGALLVLVSALALTVSDVVSVATSEISIQSE